MQRVMKSLAIWMKSITRKLCYFHAIVTYTYNSKCVGGISKSRNFALI